MSYRDGAPMDVGATEQLLIDDHILEDMWDMQRVVCQPRRHPTGRLMCGDQPWEEWIGAPRVLWDEQADLYRMLYTAHSTEAWQYQFVPELMDQWSMEKHGPSYFTCYAESGDGMEWTKSALNTHTWRGMTNTNIAATGATKAQAHTVVLNPDPSDPSRRFIMMYRDRRPTLLDVQAHYLLYSPDGKTWTEDPGNPVVAPGNDGSDTLVWDSATSRWFLFVRPRVVPFYPKAADLPRIGNPKRRMAVMTSPDLHNWTFPRTVMFPDELDSTPMDMDLWTVFKHGSHFITIMSHMDETQAGLTKSEIMSSADGYTWSRLPGRPTFFERGPEGSWDAGQAFLYTAGSPVEQGDHWLLYYTGTPYGQKDRRENPGGIGVALLQKGRMVGRFAGQRDGFLLTKELIVGGKYLELNCEMRQAGSIRVGFSKRSHRPNEQYDEGCYEGFDVTDCDVVNGDGYALRVKFNGNDDLSALKGKPAYLRFHVRNAGVYSFRFTD
ncbi:MAG: hypothetical protein JXA11_17200 [Phycisphaerae bacterium]|nr:hypothetical protein [Phycisphaerae bacterium]